MVQCPLCEGYRTLPTFSDGPRGGAYNPAQMCGLCQGAGEISEQKAEWLRIGKAFRDERVRLGITVFRAAVSLEVSPVELSAMEHGRQDPARLAAALK